MSALRLGRLPDGTRDVRPIDEGVPVVAKPNGFLRGSTGAEMIPPATTTWQQLRAVAGHPGARFNGPIR